MLDGLLLPGQSTLTERDQETIGFNGTMNGWLSSSRFLRIQEVVQLLANGRVTEDLTPRSLTTPLKSYRDPIGKDRLPTTIFQGRAVKLQGCMYDIQIYWHGIDEFLCMMLMETTAQIEMDNVTVLKTN